MTDVREKLFAFLDSKTTFEIINQMKQYTEPDKFVGFYFLPESVDSISLGERVYNATDDIIDVTYAPMPIVSVQIDVRGVGSFLESRSLYYGFQRWQDELKVVGLYFRGVGTISPIPNVQNGYVKEGYQFDISLSYDTSIITTVDYATTTKLK